MNKAWLEQKTKECESVRPEIEKLLREKLPLTNQEMDEVFEDLENMYRGVEFYLDMLCFKDLEDDSEDSHKWISQSGVVELFYKYRNKNKIFLQGYGHVISIVPVRLLCTNPYIKEFA